MNPPEWNIGVKIGAASSPVSSQLMMVLKEFHRIIRWGRIAPLGRPVVPEV